MAAQGTTTVTDMTTTTTATSTTATSTTETTTTTTTTTLPPPFSNILEEPTDANSNWDMRADIEAVVAEEFPDFAGKEVQLERCFSVAEFQANSNCYPDCDFVQEKGPVSYYYPQKDSVRKYASDYMEPPSHGVAAFHAACDGKGPLVAVTKTDTGHIFGGALDIPYAKPDGPPCSNDPDCKADPDCDATGNQGCSPAKGYYLESENAFTFCLKCAGIADERPARGLDVYKLDETKRGTRGAVGLRSAEYSSLTGPAFGSGPDMQMGTEAYAKTTGQAYFHSYECPLPADEADRQNKCWVWYTGTKTWKGVDMEVFVVHYDDKPIPKPQWVTEAEVRYPHSPPSALLPFPSPWHSPARV